LQFTIGDYSKIGANAVVLTDVPPYGVAVGIPAKIIKAK
jgi:serine O-acetyltransferase